MTIASLDNLINALANNRQKFPFAKTTSRTSQVAGQSTSWWDAAGFTPAGTYPAAGATAVCDNTTLGGIKFDNPTGTDKTHVAKIAILAPGVQGFELHDRLLHSGAFVANVTTAQTVTGCDLLTQAAVSNISQRMGKSDYSSVQWWFEWSGNTGATASNATVTYTDQDGVTRTAAVIAVGGSVAAGRMLPIIPNAGQYIRGIQQIQLSASTGTAGAFRVVATLQRTEFYTAATNQQLVFDWTQTGFPVIYDSSCLFIVGLNAGTTSFAPSGAITLVQG